MDIKPFNQPLPDYWTSLGSLATFALGIAALSLAAILVVVFFKDRRFWAFPLFLVAFVTATMGGAAGQADVQKKAQENYNNAVSDLKDSLTHDGFKIISGTPELHPNTQSKMLLAYGSKNFDCTMFSPEDVNTSIVFSCGEAKLSLDQIKEQR